MSAHESRVSAAIRAAKQQRRGALIGYLPVGFPNLDTSVDAAIAMARSGVDVLEFGLPYSDPVMDGAVIQEATETALADGFRLRHVFEAVRRVREAVDVPVLVMTYWNPVVQYGVDRFASDLSAAGGAGLITPDITPDSAADWIEISSKYDLDRVFLAAPSSTDERLGLIAAQSTGFVYTVSTMGITGERADLDAAARGDRFGPGRPTLLASALVGQPGTTRAAPNSPRDRHVATTPRIPEPGHDRQCWELAQAVRARMMSFKMPGCWLENVVAGSSPARRASCALIQSLTPSLRTTRSIPRESCIRRACPVPPSLTAISSHP